MSDIENPNQDKKLTPAQLFAESLKPHHDTVNAISGIQLAGTLYNI